MIPPRLELQVLQKAKHRALDVARLPGESRLAPARDDLKVGEAFRQLCRNTAGEPPSHHAVRGSLGAVVEVQNGGPGREIGVNPRIQSFLQQVVSCLNVTERIQSCVVGALAQCLRPQRGKQAQGFLPPPRLAAGAHGGIVADAAGRHLPLLHEPQGVQRQVPLIAFLQAADERIVADDRRLQRDLRHALEEVKAQLPGLALLTGTDHGILRRDAWSNLPESELFFWRGEIDSSLPRL